MYNKLTKSARMLGLVLGLSAGPAVPSYAYVISFDTLTNLTPAPGSSIAFDNANPYQGKDSILLNWSGGTGYFDYALPSVTNFSGETISFAAYDSSSITQIAFELLDSSKNVAAGWYWNVQPSQYNIWTPLTVTQGSASGATLYTTGTGDITQIKYLRMTDTGTGPNGWATPEPGTVLLLGTGLALLSVKRRTMVT